MNSNLLVLGIFCCISVSMAAMCSTEKCATMICAPLTEVECLSRNSAMYRYDPHGGFCGCCPACVRVLGLGDKCSTIHPLDVPAHEDCAQGLSCDMRKHVCVKLEAVPVGPVPVGK